MHHLFPSRKASRFDVYVDALDRQLYTQCKPSSDIDFTTKWKTFTKSLNPFKLQPLADNISTSGQPVHSAILSGELPSNKWLDGKIEGSEVAHLQLQSHEATLSEGRSTSLLTIEASSNPASLYSKIGGLSLLESQATVVPDLSACDTTSAQESFPIRTKIGSDDAKKYELRAFADQPGLYYSSVVWPEELPHRGSSFSIERLRKDLNTHIQDSCKDKANQRIMRKKRISLTGKAFAIELRLSGNIDANKEDIQLRPTIWIICASDFYKKLVADALCQTQLEWAEEEPKEIVGGLAFSGRRDRVENLDFSGGICFMNSYQLHIHTEEPGDDNSACGLITCATLMKDGNIMDQRVSRLGGLLMLNSEVVCGSSTAHGILDMLMSVDVDFAQGEDGDSWDISDSDAETEVDSDGSTGLESEVDDRLFSPTLERAPSNPERQRNPTVSSVARWNIVPEIIILSFIRMVLPSLDQFWTLSTEVNAHDIALFEIGRRDPFQKLVNSYKYESIKHLVKTESTDDLCSQPYLKVMVLLGHDSFAHGRILPGISTICMAGVEFNTMRIFLDDSLAPGTSGSWVVSDSHLHGIVVASNSREPIAHIITARQIFCDIKSSLPSVKSIQLPTDTARIKEAKVTEPTPASMPSWGGFIGEHAAKLLTPKPRGHRSIPLPSQLQEISSACVPSTSVTDGVGINPCNTISIENLPADVSEAELKSMVVCQQGLERMYLRRMEHGTLCLVEFNDVLSAGRALQTLDGWLLRIGFEMRVRATFFSRSHGIPPDTTVITSQDLSRLGFSQLKGAEKPKADCSMATITALPHELLAHIEDKAVIAPNPFRSLTEQALSSLNGDYAQNSISEWIEGRPQFSPAGQTSDIMDTLQFSPADQTSDIMDTLQGSPPADFSGSDWDLFDGNEICVKPSRNQDKDVSHVDAAMPLTEDRSLLYPEDLEGLA